MAATIQSQTISNINQIFGLSQQMLNLYVQITALQNAWNDDGSLNALNAMQTCVQNADGSLGAADTTPNGAHPINVNNTSYVGLQRAATPNEITAALTQLENIVSFINGGALAATPGVRQVLNVLTGG
jgi:hypothetical protein